MYNLANCINKMEVSDDPAKRKGERGRGERERERGNRQVLLRACHFVKLGEYKLTRIPVQSFYLVPQISVKFSR